MKPILLMIEGLPFHREILLGFSAFDEAEFPRDLVACRFQHLGHMLRVRRWAGIVALAASPGIAERLRGLDAPVVNLSMRLPETGLPTVAPDNHAVGRVAAEHFLERGFRTFAYLEFSDAWFSGERHAGYRERLAEAGHDVLPLKKSTFRLAEEYGSISPAGEAFRAWLASMPKPAALFAATDEFAARANAFCRAQGIRVPDDVAILGCDNDPVSSILNHPPRSSVDLAPFAIGWHAAEVLHGLMLGKPPPDAPVRLPPGPVVTRQSTDILAVEDPFVAKALAFLNANLGEPLQVTDLARAAGLSRRPMEARFRKCLGQTPLEVIKKARLAKARVFIVAGDLSVAEISRRTGFASPEQFAKAFKRFHGVPPSQYRKNCRPPSAPAVQAVEPR